MHMFFFTIIVGLVTVGKCQCGSYVTTSSGSRDVVNTCYKSGSTWRMLKCQGSSVIREDYSTSSCSGTPTSSANVTSQFPGKKQCTGSPCKVTVEEYNTSSVCAGGPSGGPFASAMNPTCHGSDGLKTYCDSSFVYIYSYGDASCPATANVNSSITKVKMGCSASFGSTTSTKFSGCQMTGPKPSLAFGSGSRTLVIRFGPNNCAGNPDLSSEGPLSICDASSSTNSSTRLYCSGNGGALWFYSFNDKMCSQSKFSGVSYINTGCNVATSLFSGINSNYTFAMSCNGGPAPPQIDFQGSPYANMLVYKDSSCTTFLLGAYLRAGGMCDKNSDGTATIAECLAGGKANVTEYNVNHAGCTTNVNKTQIFDSSCRLMQGTDINGQAVYAKVASCGTNGKVNPADAPNVQVLSGVAPVKVSLTVIFLVCCLIIA